MQESQEKNDKIAELEKQVAKAGRYEKKATPTTKQPVAWFKLHQFHCWLFPSYVKIIEHQYHHKTKVIFFFSQRHENLLIELKYFASHTFEGLKTA